MNDHAASRRFLRIGTIVCAIALLAACAADKAAQTTPTTAVAPPPDAMRDLIPEGVDPNRVTLGPNDLVEIRVFREPDMSGRYRISEEGTIEFPLVGNLECGGGTTTDLERLIREKLTEGGYLTTPSVTVLIVEYNSRKVFILGQVDKPGTYVYEPRMSVVQLISMAGGFKENAARNATTIARKVRGKEVRITVPVEDISYGRAVNFMLMPGDIVYVPDSWL